MSNGDFSAVQYLLFVSPFVATILLVFGMKYFSALFQARARIADDMTYRVLAEKVVDMKSELAAVRVEISRVASSLAVLEKILQQVE
jgi:hypothetical protein